MSTWKDELPEEIKISPALKDIADIPSLAKQFVDQQSFLGNALRVPGPDAGDADKKAFRQKLMEKVPELIPTPNQDDPELMEALFRKFGKPEKADGYEAPEGVPADQNDVKMFRDIAHKAGLTKKQFQHIVKELNTYNTRVAQMEDINVQNGVRNLRNEWGIAFDDRLSFVQKALVATEAPKELMDAVTDGTAGPETIKWIHKLGQRLGAEGINLAADGFNASERLTPQEAQAQINEIMGNRDHAYWKGGHPDQKAAIDKMVKLTRMANPGMKDV